MRPKTTRAMPMMFALILPALAAGGCRADVDAKAKTEVASPKAVLASPRVDVDAPSAASQPADARAAQTVSGGDARQVTTAVTLSGSGWPLTVLGAAALGLAWLWLKNRHGRRRAEREINQFGFRLHAAQAGLKNATTGLTAIAAAVKDLGPGPQRDRVLKAVKARLSPVERGALDEMLKQRGLYASRSKAPDETAAACPPGQVR